MLFAMGKASRKNQLKNKVAPIPFVARPFADLPFEAYLVALRDFIPCGYLSVKTKQEYGATEALLVSYLPQGQSGMRRADGMPLVALRANAKTGDAAHDVGTVLARVLELEPGQALEGFDIRQPGPRLHDVIEHEELDFAVTSTFDFWIAPDKLNDEDVQQALAASEGESVPSALVPGTKSAFWCRMNHDFVRWVRTESESALFDALARLKVQGKANLGEGTRFIGAFRTCGLLVPVFESEQRVEPADLQEGAERLEQLLQVQLADSAPLNDEERRARAGLVSRQISLR